MKKLIKKHLNGKNIYYISPQYGFSPTTSQTNVYQPIITDIQRDVAQGKPIGTTTAKREIRAAQQKQQETILAPVLSREGQDIVNKAAQTANIIQPINTTLDVAEYFPVVGDAISMGRAASEAVNGNLLDAGLMAGLTLIPGITSKIPNKYILRRPFKKHPGNASYFEHNYLPRIENIVGERSHKKIKDYLSSKGFHGDSWGYFRSPDDTYTVYMDTPILDAPFAVPQSAEKVIEKGSLKQHPIKFVSHSGKVINGTQNTQVFREFPKIHLSSRFPQHGVIGISRGPNWSPSNLEYTAHATVSDFEIPLFNNPEFNASLAKEIEHIENLTGYPVVGSSRIIADGIIGGVPGDVEIVVPKDKVEKIKKILKFNETRKTAGDTGIAGTSPKVLIGKDADNIDINIIDDNGTIIHLLYETQNPQGIEKLYTQHALTQQKYSSVPSPSIKLKLPKSAKEIVKEMTLDPQYTTLTVVDNVFKSSKDKHVIRKTAILSNNNPKAISAATRAIDNMYSLIRGFLKFTDRYPSQQFNNPIENKEILKQIGWNYGNLNEIAQNELMMKNIVNDWYIRQVETTRSINFDKKGDETFENILSPKRQYGGGSASGGGGNSVLGSDIGGNVAEYTSYGVYHPLVDPNTAKFSDVISAINREHDVWDDHELVNNAIKKVLSMPRFQKISKENIPPNNDFTSFISNLQSKGLLSNEEANDFISQVSKELKVSGFRSNYMYGSIGKYFGIMRDPDAVSYRNIYNNGPHPANPAEFGKNLIKSTLLTHTDYPVTKLVSRFDPVLKLNKNDLKVAMEHRKLVQEGKSERDKAILIAKNRSQKYVDLHRKYDNKQITLQNIKNASLLTSALGAVSALPIYAYNDSRQSIKLYQFYDENSERLDKIIEKEIGKEPDYEKDGKKKYREWDKKFKKILKREYEKANL